MRAAVPVRRRCCACCSLFFVCVTFSKVRFGLRPPVILPPVSLRRVSETNKRNRTDRHSQREEQANCTPHATHQQQVTTRTGVGVPVHMALLPLFLWCCCVVLLLIRSLTWSDPFSSAVAELHATNAPNPTTTIKTQSKHTPHHKQLSFEKTERSGEYNTITRGHASILSQRLCRVTTNPTTPTFTPQYGHNRRECLLDTRVRPNRFTRASVLHVGDDAHFLSSPLLSLFLPPPAMILASILISTLTMPAAAASTAISASVAHTSMCRNRRDYTIRCAR